MKYKRHGAIHGKKAAFYHTFLLKKKQLAEWWNSRLNSNTFSRGNLHVSNHETTEILVLCTLLSIGLQAFRIMYTGDLLFSFLIWNLFLAYIPLVLSARVEVCIKKNNRWTMLVLTFAWLLFIPNSFYIITDLFHLDMNHGVPLWYDLALLLSFAWNGLLFGIVSVRQMENAIDRYFNRRLHLLFILPVMFLNAFGIYVGRFLRFNSWDVLASPLQLAGDIAYLFLHPIRNRFDWSMIICYAMLMTVIYLTIKKLAKT